MSNIDIATVAKAQRWVLLSVLANVLLNILWYVAPDTLPLVLALSVASLLTVAGIIVSLVLLMLALKRPVVSIVLASFAQFIPIVSLLVLLVVNQRATTTLKSAGIRVGLLGAKK